MAFGAEIPLIIGLVGVAFAVLERGYKRFLEQKKLEPDLQFGGTYMLNLLISTGIGTALVAGVIPTLITEMGTVDEVAELTLASIFLNFILGYTVTYRILDALNTSTDRKIELAEIEAKEAEAETPTTTTTTTTPTHS